MLANFHTHTVFCDGAATPEDIVRAAIDRGFTAIGLSGHGYTPFDLEYCMTDTEGYLAEIARLKQQYGDRIHIYAGVEEDALAPVDRQRFDYIIGSSHYLRVGGEYLSVDSGHDHFKRCLKAYQNDPLRLAQDYYEAFCAYIHARKPDVIGHFDLITKYDETDASLFLKNAEYHRLAEQAIANAAQSGCVFEVNTSAIARGLRTTPYPSESLLHVLKQQGARLMLSSDSHSVDTLDFWFEQAEQYLYDVGFRALYTLSDGQFVAYSIR